MRGSRRTATLQTNDDLIEYLYIKLVKIISTYAPEECHSPSLLKEKEDNCNDG